MSRLLFVDTETTGLNPALHVPWEVAIVEENGVEHLWRWRPSEGAMRRAEPKALEVGRFDQRAPKVHTEEAEWYAASSIAEIVVGATLVGVNVAFDAGMLSSWLSYHRFTPGWHYRTVSVEVMAAGYLYGHSHAAAASLGGPQADYVRPAAERQPWRSYDLSWECGIAPPDGDSAHTALGDARWVKRWYERLTGQEVTA